MRDAVIVSTARTPLAKSIRGAFNATHPVQLGAWSVEAAVSRAGIDGEEIEDWNLNVSVDNMKRRMIMRAIGETGSKTRAAERLGIPRQSLQKMMKRLCVC